MKNIIQFKVAAEHIKQKRTLDNQRPRDKKLTGEPAYHDRITGDVLTITTNG